MVFQLTVKISVAGTDVSLLEIGEPEKGRQGQVTRDGGLRRTGIGKKLSGAILNNACMARRASPRDGTSSVEFRRAAGWSSQANAVRSTDFAAGIAKGSAVLPFARSLILKLHVLPNIK